jgi:hypothetical protein
MPLHTVLPLTASLAELVDVVVLGDASPFNVKEEKQVLLQYKNATGLKDLHQEIMKMVYIRSQLINIC